VQHREVADEVEGRHARHLRHRLERQRLVVMRLDVVGGEAQPPRELGARRRLHGRKAQRAVDFWYVRALDMFGRPGSKRSERYRYWGLKRRTNEQARQDYMNEVGPIRTQMGLKIPDPNKGRRYN
jgi:hypothetical protein